ncbi:hypothetical protein VCUG_00186 [Vavraia culicis subsp. floridensis]|uniref:Uncharacterized protein n=1 Tax=Vavraia culicis (isolate floridensis) TaxID=948595 RepID=L2GZ25_VAVCU|nr:uncharacterized protein VCUG_00186 [Vavraia culicis subsp. floridensis]ELA48350.1 hypothetical protein VCUG_00186 [Vavraia culicis subsp. floridensis]
MSIAKNRFEKLFNFYFPHLSYHLHQSTEPINCKLTFLDLEVEIDDKYENYDKCETAIFELGEKILSKYIEDLSQHQEENASNSIGAGKKTNIDKTGENTEKMRTDRSNIGGDESAEVVKKMENAIKKRNSKPVESTVQTDGPMISQCPDFYAKQVHTLCICYSLPFPEYHFLKEDGLYRCYTLYGSKNYESEYFYEKNDAKEFVCKAIADNIKSGVLNDEN